MLPIYFRFHAMLLIAGSGLPTSDTFSTTFVNNSKKVDIPATANVEDLIRSFEEKDIVSQVKPSGENGLGSVAQVCGDHNSKEVMNCEPSFAELVVVQDEPQETKQPYSDVTKFLKPTTAFINSQEKIDSGEIGLDVTDLKLLTRSMQTYKHNKIINITDVDDDNSDTDQELPSRNLTLFPFRKLGAQRSSPFMQALNTRRTSMKQNLISYTSHQELLKELSSAILEILKTIKIKHLYIVYQNESDCCLAKGIAGSGRKVNVYQYLPWWLHVSKFTYTHNSQHILVGSIDWIVDTMSKVSELYNDYRLNALHTRWIWVCSELLFPELSPSPTVSFTKSLERVSLSLQEEMRGVLMVQKESGKIGKSQKKSLINIAGIKAPGDGSWILRPSAYWENGILTQLEPFWPSLARNFHNRTIRMSVIQEPIVFVSQKGGGLDKATGYMTEVMRIARRHFNFTEKLFLTEGYGILNPDGTWNGMIGAIVRKEVDMAPLDFSPSFARLQVTDLTVATDQDTVTMISRSPSIVIKPFILMEIFSLPVWGCLIASMIFVGLLLEILDRTENKVKRIHAENKDPTNQLTNVLMVFVYQGSEYWPKGDAGRLGTAGILFVALIISSLYSGSITAFFAIPFRSKPLDSAEDLLASEVQPAMRLGNQPYQTMLVAPNGILHSALDRSVGVTGDDISTIPFLEKIADGSYALIDGYGTVTGRAKMIEKSGERCKIYFGKEPLRFDENVLVFRKNSPFYYQFNSLVKWLKQYGIIQFIKNNHFALPCFKDLSGDEPRPMTVVEVQSSFYVLAVGIILAFIAFILELLWPKLKVVLNSEDV